MVGPCDIEAILCTKGNPDLVEEELGLTWGPKSDISEQM